MTAIEFSEQFKVSKRYAELILSGRKVAGKKLGRLLEKKTGIPRTVWCWPEDYPGMNPYIKGEGK